MTIFKNIPPIISPNAPAAALAASAIAFNYNKNLQIDQLDLFLLLEH